MDKIAFVAGLFVMAAICIVLAFEHQYDNYRFWRHGQDALMQDADPLIRRAARHAPEQTLQATVKFVTPDGREVLSRRFLDADLVRQLAAGQQVAIRFLDGDPHPIRFAGEVYPMRWGLLLLGLALLPTAVYALRRLRQEGVGSG